MAWIAVDDVVEPRHELVDVLAVERRDERVLELAGHLAIDLVAGLLEGLDAGDPLIEPVVLLDHLVERPGGRLEVVAVGDEQFEELGVLGQQSEAHRGLSGWFGPGGRWVVMTGRSRSAPARRGRPGSRPRGGSGPRR